MEPDTQDRLLDLLKIAAAAISAAPAVRGDDAYEIFDTVCIGVVWYPEDTTLRLYLSHDIPDYYDREILFDGESALNPDSVRVTVEHAMEDGRQRGNRLARERRARKRQAKQLAPGRAERGVPDARFEP